MTLQSCTVSGTKVKVNACLSVCLYLSVSVTYLLETDELSDDLRLIRYLYTCITVIASFHFVLRENMVA